MDSRFYYNGDSNKELNNAKSDGFVIQSLSIKYIEYKNVRPLLAELLNFYPDIKHRQDRKPIDLIVRYEPTLSQMIENIESELNVGDRVIIIDGQFKNKKAKIKNKNINGTVDLILKIQRNGNKEEALLTLEPRQITSYFKIGTLVKVVKGSHKGQSGYVLNVKGDEVQITSELNQQNIKINKQDLAFIHSNYKETNQIETTTDQN